MKVFHDLQYYYYSFPRSTVLLLYTPRRAAVLEFNKAASMRQFHAPSRAMRGSSLSVCRAKANVRDLAIIIIYITNIIKDLFIGIFIFLNDKMSYFICNDKELFLQKTI